MAELGSKEGIEAQIQALKRVYICSLPEKKRKLNTTWQHLMRAGFNRMTVIELAQLAHKLTGSGGLYGIPGISHAAGDVENELATVLVENQLSSEASTRLEILLGRLDQALDDGATPV